MWIRGGWLASLTVLVGCAGGPARVESWSPPSPCARAVVLVVDGAGGFTGSYNALSQAVQDFGLPLASAVYRVDPRRSAAVLSGSDRHGVRPGDGPTPGGAGAAGSTGKPPGKPIVLMGAQRRRHLGGPGLRGEHYLRSPWSASCCWLPPCRGVTICDRLSTSPRGAALMRSPARGVIVSTWVWGSALQTRNHRRQTRGSRRSHRVLQSLPDCGRRGPLRCQTAPVPLGSVGSLDRQRGPAATAPIGRPFCARNCCPCCVRGQGESGGFRRGTARSGRPVHLRRQTQTKLGQQLGRLVEVFQAHHFDRAVHVAVGECQPGPSPRPRATAASHWHRCRLAGARREPAP